MKRGAPTRKKRAMAAVSLVLASAMLAVTPACSALARDEEERIFVADADELSVLTFNVFGHPLLSLLQRPARFRQMKEELTSALGDVDVVLLQEAFIPSTRVLASARRYAKRGACGADPSFNPTGLVLLTDHEPVGRSSSFAFEKGNGGRWRMRAERDLDCGALTERRKTMKGMMTMTVSTPLGEVDLVNVHLDVKAGARRAQRALIARYLKQRESARPLILAGDLNEETCDGDRGAPFPGGVELTNASCGVGPTVGGLRRGMIQGALFPAEIDSVYVCGAEPTEKRSRMFVRPRRGGHLSDHDGVLALIRFDEEHNEDEDGASSCVLQPPAAFTR